jgi:hypothetical protein
MTSLMISIVSRWESLPASPASSINRSAQSTYTGAEGRANGRKKSAETLRLSRVLRVSVGIRAAHDAEGAGGGKFSEV